MSGGNIDPDLSSNIVDEVREIYGQISSTQFQDLYIEKYRVATAEDISVEDDGSIKYGCTDYWNSQFRDAVLMPFVPNAYGESIINLKVKLRKSGNAYNGSFGLVWGSQDATWLYQMLRIQYESNIAKIGIFECKTLNQAFGLDDGGSSNVQPHPDMTPLTLTALPISEIAVHDMQLIITTNGSVTGLRFVYKHNNKTHYISPMIKDSLNILTSGVVFGLGNIATGNSWYIYSLLMDKGQKILRR